MQSVFTILLSLLVALTGTSSVMAQACVGDCDDDAQVTIDEVLILVDGVLGGDAGERCPQGDTDGSGTITVDELLTAITLALDGCAPHETPTAPATATPSPQATPTVIVPTSPLGARRIRFDTEHSAFAVVDQTVAPVAARGVGVIGASGGALATPYLDLDAHAADNQGLALIDVVGGSEVIFADARETLGVILCFEPFYPVPNAGVIDCDGGSGLGLDLEIDHKPGQLGVEGFTEADCRSLGGTVESPHQICGNAEMLGEPCRAAADCDLPAGGATGVCGLELAQCSRGTVGISCRADADCDTGPGLLDGICGVEDPHPGICNGPLRVRQLNAASAPGDLLFAPAAVGGFQLSGLPGRLTIERALPCGDEGDGELTSLSLTTAQARTTVIEFSVVEGIVTLDESGEPLSCSAWESDAATFHVQLPHLHGTRELTDLIYSLRLVVANESAAAPAIAR